MDEVGHSLRETAQRYRAIVESRRALVARYDLEGRFKFGNAALGRALGARSSELSGTQVFEMIHPDDRPMVMQSFRQVAAPPYHVAGETRLETLNRWRTLEWEADAVRDDVGCILEIQVIAWDVTEARMLEGRASDMLRSFGRLGAGLAHEINSPCGTILAQARLALANPALAAAHPELRASLEAIANEAKRCGELASFILGNATGHGCDKQRAHVNDVVRATAEHCQRYVNSRQARLTLVLADDLPSVTMRVPEVQVVLINLVRNAVERRPGISVWVTTRATATRIEVRVEDDGPGIPGPLREVVFEWSCTARRGRSSGIGLPLCREIAKEHGGGLRAEASGVGGASMILTLPVSDLPIATADE